MLETPESLNCYNVIGNDERESLKNIKDWAISSQVTEESVKGSTTRSRSPERTVKTQECAPRKGRYSLVCQEIGREFINSSPLTQTNSVPYSGKLDDLSLHPVKEVIKKVLKNDASKAFDIIARAQFDATPLTVASATATDAVTLETNGTCTVTNNVALGKDHVKAIVDIMKERNIPTFSAGDYFAIGRPSTFRQIKNDLEGIHQYVESGYRLIMNGEIGRYEGVRLIKSLFSKIIGIFSMPLCFA